MLGIITGISGCGRKEYLAKFEEFARKRGKKVKTYNVGSMLFEKARQIGVNITPENVLNANPQVIHALRAAVFETILEELPQALKKYEAVFLNIHSLFYWKKFFRRAYDYFYLNQLSPDFYITFIDKGDVILERLNNREQWKQEKLTLHEILIWQNVEVEFTASAAELQKKEFYTLASRQPLSTLYKLVFVKSAEPVYVSMPMTHVKSRNDLRRVNNFVERLNRYFTVFDPRTIEIGPVNVSKFRRLKRDHVSDYHQTVARDLYWLIKQSKKVVAFFPRIVSSPGVINELREAFETNKDVWLIYPEKVGSPFLTYFCSKIFRNEEEFFNFLDKDLKLKRLNI